MLKEYKTVSEVVELDGCRSRRVKYENQEIETNRGKRRGRVLEVSGTEL